jgi:carbonic anhydrase/acetyltransferase-like protein (isoleucine patch superfamily)
VSFDLMCGKIETLEHLTHLVLDPEALALGDARLAANPIVRPRRSVRGDNLQVVLVHFVICQWSQREKS